MNETSPARPQGIPARRPYLLVAAIAVSVGAVNVLAAGIASALPAVPATVLEMVTESAVVILVVALVTALRAWRSVGVGTLRRVRDLRFYWIPLLPVLPVILPAAIAVSRTRIESVLFLLVLACLVAVAEELCFRGLILQVLAPHGLWRAAVLSSLVFGAMHLVNLLFGADPAATLLQVVYATAMGFGFAAVTLRTGTLLPLIGIHAAIDFAGLLLAGETVTTSTSSTDVLVSSLYIALFTTYGFVLLHVITRKPRRRAQARTGVAA